MCRPEILNSISTPDRVALLTVTYEPEYTHLLSSACTQAHIHTQTEHAML